MSGDRGGAGVIPIARLAALGGGVLRAGPAALASAADHYVAPNGSGTACTSANPCALTTQADDGMCGGETLFMQPGTYELTGIVNLGKSPAIVMRPDPAFPGVRPLIHSVNGGRLGVGGVDVRDVDFEVSGLSGGSSALIMQGGTNTATRLRVVASGSAGARGVTVGPGLVQDSTVWTTSSSGVAVGGGSGELRNVTALASGT